MTLAPIPMESWNVATRKWFADFGIEETWCFSLPLRVRFRGVETRQGLLLRGPHGWGEFSPFLEYESEEASFWLNSAVESATTAPPPAVRDTVPVNAIIPVVPVPQAVQMALASGASTVKIKVADPRSTLTEDVDRVRAVAAALADAHGDCARVRVDANGAWTEAEALVAIEALNEAAGGLEYVEQPCPEVEQLVNVRKHSPCPIAADESIRRAADPYRVAEMEAADLAVIKVSPLGGVRRALALAENLGLSVVVSSAVDSSVGLAAGVQLAAALPRLDHACGLGTGRLLAADVMAPPLQPEGGQIATIAAAQATHFCPVENGRPPVERWVARTEEVIGWLIGHQ